MRQKEKNKAKKHKQTNTNKTKQRQKNLWCEDFGFLCPRVLQNAE